MTADWEQQDHTSSLRRLVKPAALVAVGLAAGLVTLPGGGPQQLPVVVETPHPETEAPQPAAPGPGAGRWAVADGGQLSPRAKPVSAWTGDEMLVWGGVSFAEKRLLRDGGAYDPDSDRWRSVPDAPIRGRTEAGSVWTGDELIVWGGVGKGFDDLLADGAAYDPRRNRWRRLPPAPLTARQAAHAVWTGDVMVVWGGHVGDGAELDDGARYDPVANRWTRLPDGPLTGRGSRNVSVVAVDGGVFVWSSSAADAVAVRYDAASDSWTRLWTPRFDRAQPPVFVATGGGVLAWGRARIGDRAPLAMKYTAEPDWWAVVGRPPSAPRGGEQLVSGGGIAVSWSRSVAGGSGVAFNELTNQWLPMAGPPQPIPVGWPVQVWADDRLIVWYPTAAPAASNRTVVWTPGNPWRPLEAEGVQAREGMSAVWTGWAHDHRQLLVWGGTGPTASTAGGAYHPDLDLWETMPEAPITGRFDHAAVWTGDEMVVLGGRESPGAPLRRDGAAYAPASRQWREVREAPIAVAAGGAAWTGRSLYAAARSSGRVEVAEYDAGADRWSGLPPPPVRSGTDLDLMWSGFELWVWTSDDSGARGAAWNPRDRSWRRLPPLDDLAGPMSVVWADRLMFVVDARGTTRSFGRGSDGWRTHPSLPASATPPQLSSTGRAIVAHDARRGRRDSLWLLDTRAQSWIAVASPALPPAAESTVVWTGRHLILFAGGRAAVLPL